MKKPTRKQQRNTLAKTIRATRCLFEKLYLARGYGAETFAGIEAGDRAIQGMISRVFRTLQTAPISPTKARENWTRLGFEIAAKIARKDYAFFERIAVTLRYGKQFEKRKLYSDILQFYIINRLYEGRGTHVEMKPCDPIELTDFLESRGHGFSHDPANNTPSTLRATCARIGAPLAIKQRTKS